MGYKIEIEFDKWEEFLCFAADLHNREIKRLEEEMTELERENFKKLEEEEDIDELKKQYPIAFQNTAYKAYNAEEKEEIRKIQTITEKMAKRQENELKPASAITTSYILSKITKIIPAKELFLGLPLTIAALFRIKCGDEFETNQSCPWQDYADLVLFLYTEYGFKAEGVKNGLKLLDEYNLIDINKDYQESRENPHITYRAADELYNLLLEDEIAF